MIESNISPGDEIQFKDSTSQRYVVVAVDENAIWVKNSSESYPFTIKNHEFYQFSKVWKAFKIGKKYKSKKGVQNITYIVVALVEEEYSNRQVAVAIMSTGRAEPVPLTPSILRDRDNYDEVR